MTENQILPSTVVRGSRTRIICVYCCISSELLNSITSSNVADGSVSHEEYIGSIHSVFFSPAPLNGEVY
jgi:hypothetical protein